MTAVSETTASQHTFTCVLQTFAGRLEWERPALRLRWPTSIDPKERRWTASVSLRPP